MTGTQVTEPVLACLWLVHGLCTGVWSGRRPLGKEDPLLDAFSEHGVYCPYSHSPSGSRTKPSDVCISCLFHILNESNSSIWIFILKGGSLLHLLCWLCAFLVSEKHAGDAVSLEALPGGLQRPTPAQFVWEPEVVNLLWKQRPGSREAMCRSSFLLEGFSPCSLCFLRPLRPSLATAPCGGPTVHRQHQGCVPQRPPQLCLSRARHLLAPYLDLLDTAPPQSRWDIHWGDPGSSFNRACRTCGRSR